MLNGTERNETEPPRHRLRLSPTSSRRPTTPPPELRRAPHKAPAFIDFRTVPAETPAFTDFEPKTGNFAPELRQPLHETPAFIDFRTSPAETPALPDFKPTISPPTSEQPRIAARALPHFRSPHDTKSRRHLRHKTLPASRSGPRNYQHRTGRPRTNSDTKSPANLFSGLQGFLQSGRARGSL